MSILKDVYNIEETNGRTILLDIPFSQYFSLDLENISKQQNQNSSVFWNFGDPESVDNEVVCSSIVNSSINHTYEYQGSYNINCIINIDGVCFHLKRNLIVN